MRLRDFIARARHEGCGGRAAKVELLTGVESASSGPVRRIVLKSPPGNGRDPRKPRPWHCPSKPFLAGS
jgi:hypothetical protein